MRLRPPISTLTDTLFPYTTLFLSPLETASFNRRGDAVHHQVKGKIGDRVTDRREFPIEDGGDLGAVRAEDEIVTAKVAMNDRNFIVVRRTEARRAGKELVSTCSSRLSPNH